MVTVSVQRLQSEDTDLNQVQTNFINALQPLGQQIRQNSSDIASNPFTDALIIKGSLSTTPTKIAQQLGKIPSGWIVVDVNANVEIHRTSWDLNSITLVATGTCIVSVLVF